MGEEERGLGGGGGHILRLSLSIQGNGMTHGTELSKERFYSSWNEGQ